MESLPNSRRSLIMELEFISDIEIIVTRLRLNCNKTDDCYQLEVLFIERYLPQLSLFNHHARKKRPVQLPLYYLK